MRKKIGKRIGPVPITLVAALALAAFLSVGFLVLSPSGAPNAQAHAGPPTHDCHYNDTVPCIVAGDSVMVGFQNTQSSTDAQDFYIYADGRIDGGTDVRYYHPAEEVNDTSNEPTTTISFLKLNVAAGQTGTATISSGGSVRVSTFVGAPTHLEINDADNLDYQPGGGGNNATPMTVNVHFTPALGAPDAGESSLTVGGMSMNNITAEGEASVVANFQDRQSPIKVIGYTYLGNPVNLDSANATVNVGTINSDGEASVTAKLRAGHSVGVGATVTVERSGDSVTGMVNSVATDADGVTTIGLIDASETDTLDAGVGASISHEYVRPVKGSVMFSVGGGSDVMLESGIVKGKTLTMTAKQASTAANLQVVGLPKSGNVRVEVTAMFTGDTGDLTKKGYATRSDSVTDDVMAQTFACKLTDEDDGDDDGATADAAEICNVEMDAKVGDLTESSVFSPEVRFLIVATVHDSADNPLNNKTVAARQTSPSDTEGITVTADTSDSKGMARLEATVKEMDDVKLGAHTIEVIQGNKKASVDVTVTGPAKNIAFSAETDPIPGNTGVGTYTVKATDEGGNLPTNVGNDNDDLEALVSVRPSKSIVLGTDDGKIKFSAKTGEATFFVQVADEAELGDLLTITVTAVGDSSIMPAVLSVMYGETPMTSNMAPMAGDDVADQMVYVDAMVEVQSNFSDPDEDTLSYTASSDMMDVATATVDDMGMVTITGVAEGMATITVTASDPGELYAMQTIMITVMMMPPMELGAPSITSVMSDADGMATVMLMPGDNATKHYIWAQPTDLSQGMYSDEAAGDATMVTFSGLTGGMNHWFIAIAGRGTGTDSEWSAWSSWTAEKPIQ